MRNKFYLQIYGHTLSFTDKDSWVDLRSIDIHPDFASQLEEYGIIEIHRGKIPAQHVKRLQKLLRLRCNLGVNLPGAAIILDLLDRVEELQDEIDRLNRLR